MIRLVLSHQKCVICLSCGENGMQKKRKGDIGKAIHSTVLLPCRTVPGSIKIFTIMEVLGPVTKETHRNPFENFNPFPVTPEV